MPVKTTPPATTAVPAPVSKKRTVTYLRVSTRDKGQDVENQRKAMLDLIAAHPEWNLCHSYIDHDSAGKPDRSQFLQLQKDAELGRYEVLVFWSLDRFSREGAYPTLHTLNKLTGWGVQWCSATEQYLDTCGVFKEAVVAILAVIAKQERLRISERVKAGIERAKLDGTAAKWGRRGPTVDPARFRHAMTIYSNAELCQVFNMSRSGVAKFKQRIRDEDDKTRLQCQTTSATATTNQK